MGARCTHCGRWFNNEKAKENHVEATHQQRLGAFGEGPE